MKIRTGITLLLLQLSMISYAQKGTEPLLVTDMLKIKTVGDVDLSPDDQAVVFTLKTIVPDAESKLDYDYNTQLWIKKIAGPALPRQLTFAKESSGQPFFSPDGKQIVFVRSVKGKSQLFLMSLDEGGEPVQLTNSPYGASSPKWSPDGKRLMFSASLSIQELLKDSVLNPGKQLPPWDFEKPGFAANGNLKVNSAKADPDGSLASIRAYLEGNERDKKAKVVDKLVFQTETSISSEMRFSHVFIIDAVAGSKQMPVSKGFYSFTNPQFITDQKIVLNADIDSSAHPDRVLESRIFTVNTNGSALKEVLGKKGIIYNLQAVSPSGKQIVYLESITNALSVPVLKVLNLDAPGQAPSVMNFDRSKNNIKFSKDGKQFYFTASSNGGSVICLADIKSLKVTQLTTTDQGISDYDIKDKNLVFAQTAVSNPSELYVADIRARQPRILSAFNSGWLQNKAISLPQKGTFINEKGLEVEYWVMKPRNFDASKKYPLLTEIHGGPASMFGPGDVSMWLEYQYFAAQGYGVMYGNPRGSSGYGEKFLRSNIEDWGTGPASDVLTALDKTVAQGWADTSRLFITGGSYAGYLTCWIISHDQRFKAASSQRGVYDLGTFFGEGNVWRMVPRYFGGYPWEEKTKAILERESPINYIQHINTPFLIFHGENDHRTGITQSEMLYKSLKVLGKPAEYIRQPGASHELTRSGDNRQRIDQLLRTYEFFERFNQK
jgi:dipeptidyl aminopeptidase/acylaminoacyl peptidase